MCIRDSDEVKGFINTVSLESDDPYTGPDRLPEWLLSLIHI